MRLPQRRYSHCIKAVAVKEPDDDYRRRYNQKNVEALNRAFFKKNFVGSDLKDMIKAKWGEDCTVQIVSQRNIYLKIYRTTVVDSEDYAKAARIIDSFSVVDRVRLEINTEKEDLPVLIKIS